MIDKKMFKKSFAAPLEKAGMKKKGQSWYLESEETVVVTNLQKCDWNDLYFINIGIWLKAFGEKSFPKEDQCQLGFRAESLFPEQRELILLGCSLEKGSPEMLIELTSFLESKLIPFLKDCLHIEKLRDMMKQGLLNRGIIWKEAKNILLD